MSRQAFEEQPWYSDVADMMIREGLSFSQSCAALGIKFTSAKDEASHERRKSFQRRFWAARNAYLAQIGSDPSLTKEVIMGALARSIVKLEEKGDHDKVATAAKTLSDIAGWTKEGTQVTILGSMSQHELEQLKAKARALAVNPKPIKDGEAN
jgi:hypothetical protein